MKTNQFKSFSPKALAIAALSVATLASCSKDEISQDMSQNSPQNEAVIVSKATGQYMVILKDNNDISVRKRGLPYGKQLEAVKNMAKSMLNENGINGIELSEENTFAAITNGFTAKLTPTQLEALKKDNRVAYIEQDMFVAMGNPHGSGGGGGKTKTTTTTTTTTTTSGGTTSGGTTTDTTGTGGTTTTTTDPTPADGTTVSTQVVPWGIAKVGGAGDGTGKTAWIIDSGIDPNHTDLNVDKTRSKSFLTSTQAGNYSSYADEFGHGTEVAGIIGAKNNSYGTVGVAPNASLVSLRIMDANGSAYLSKIVAALNWVATYGKAGDVINLSIGTAASTTLDDAVKNVAAKGIFVAIAAGNSSADASNYSPARVNATNVYTVSNMTSAGALNSTSNYGATTVDYAAPGTNIYTTAKGGGYATVGGTSFSSPHMAGVLLMTGGNPKYSGYITGDKDNKPDPIVSR